MVLLMIILSREEFLEEILEGFLEIGITGATVLSSRGMGEILSEDVPIFAGLRGLFPGQEGKHHLILSAAEADKAEEAVALLGKIMGSLETRGSGIAFTLPIQNCWGLAREF